ncbi:MAG: S41 family peptidase [Bacteriovoracaceae bacterium]|nr:S41 family peptidase [Bacteriovoracaceae bacterium]
MKKIKMRGLKVLLICLTISLGGILSGFIGTKTVMAVSKSRFEKLELFNKVLYLIESHYYRPVDSDKLIQGAIRGMMETLDPHSSFLGKDLFSKMQEDTSGEFGGLGIEVSQKDGVIIIITPIEDSPAHKAGLLPGDKIVEVDHESVVGLGLSKATEKMKGKAGTKINLGIIRDGTEGVNYYDVTRKIIKKSATKSAIVRDEFIYLRLTQFLKGASSYLVDEIIKNKKRMKKEKNVLKGIILDLRSNPGGLLDEAVNVSSIFLKSGVVVSTEGRNKKDKEIRYVKKSGFKELSVPVVVLVNGSSASASEIVAGALQDHNRAIIMGSQSFGKGSVQTVSKIDSETGIKLTIAQYLTPKQRRIQAIGIRPDVVLDDVEGDWVSGHSRPSSTIREKDLRNHLTATIETSEEKKNRLAEEKTERMERIKAYKNRKKDMKLKKTPKKVWSQRYDPKKDYTVQQAINYISSFDVFKKMRTL